MSTFLLCQSQAAKQQLAAGAATLQNVRERCQRASGSWTMLAAHSKRAEEACIRAAEEKLLDALNENPDRGHATA